MRNLRPNKDENIPDFLLRLLLFYYALRLLLKILDVLNPSTIPVYNPITIAIADFIFSYTGFQHGDELAIRRSELKSELPSHEYYQLRIDPYFQAGYVLLSIFFTCAGCLSGENLLFPFKIEGPLSAGLNLTTQGLFKANTVVFAYSARKNDIEMHKQGNQRR